MSAAVIGIIAHAGKVGARRMAATLFEEFTRRGALPLLEEKTAASIQREGGHSVEELSQCCELLVALGGDGTILRVLKDLGEASTPILGINLGSLGFLTCVSSHDAMRAVDSILARDYQLSKRQLLRVTVHREGHQIATQRALNDVVLNRGLVSRMIRSEALVNGNLITSYHADGIIVATATGSTAYALAAGGPIVAPHAGVFVITPICPHVLTNRPVIVDDEAHIEILLSPGQHDLSLNVDGAELVKVQSGDHIIIHKARRQLALAIPPGVTFFDVLREKLNWSGSAL